jgi:quercetin dioxygenase-like cupin family protein
MLTPTLIPIVVSQSQGKQFDVLGHAVTMQIARRESAGHYYVFSLTTPPGHGIPPHVHEREDELIHVVAGTFLIALGDRQYTAGPGDQIFFPRHVPHAFQNIGSTAGQTVWTVVPGGNFEAFFERLGALPPGPPDPQQVSAIFAEFGMTILAP